MVSAHTDIKIDTNHEDDPHRNTHQSRDDQLDHHDCQNPDDQPDHHDCQNPDDQPDHHDCQNHHDHPQRHHNHRDNSRPALDRTAIVRWAAGMGAVTAEAVAVHLGVSAASARGRLRAAEGERLLQRCRPLTGHPALYTVTRAGLRKAEARGIEPCTVSASNALHLIECARVAAALERCYPDHRLQGERELRGEERERRCALASAEVGIGMRGERGSRHHPDLVLWPIYADAGLPVAVEVELTVKAPERLAAICRAWARTRCVAGVLYLAPPEAERAVLRAIDRAQAHERVVVVPLDALPAPLGPSS